MLFIVSGFISCLDASMTVSLFLCPTLQTHVDGAPFNLDSSGVNMVSPVHLRLLSGFTTRSAQLSHFSDSFAVTSGFVVTFGLVEHEHAWQTEIGIFELFMVSGFISCLHVPNCFLIPVSDTADARGLCALQPTVQV